MAVTLSPRPERSNGTTAALREADPPRADTPRADAPRPAGRSRRPLTPLAALTAGATAALGVILFYIMAAIFKEVVPPAIGLGALALVVAAVVALTRRRWTPILGSVVALLLGAVLLVPAGSEIAHSLGTPNDPMFGVLIVLFPCLAIAVLAGIAATVQNYRWSAGAGPAPRAPGWLAPALIALVGVIAGANAVAAIPQKGAAASVSPDVLAALPALGVKGFAFQQTELRVKAGEVVALRLDNADQAPHSFDVDELGVHAPIPVGQGGMALFRPTAPGNYTFYCAPHYDKASGQGMKGTLIVE
jgi:plastocyanin